MQTLNFVTQKIFVKISFQVFKKPLKMVRKYALYLVLDLHSDIFALRTAITISH